MSRPSRCGRSRSRGRARWSVSPVRASTALLYTMDPDFRELFKVKANFDMRIDRTRSTRRDYAGPDRRRHPARRPAAGRPQRRRPRGRGGHAPGRRPQQALDPVWRRSRTSCARRPTGRVRRTPTVITEEHISHAIASRYERVNLIERNIREAMRERDHRGRHRGRGRRSGQRPLRHRPRRHGLRPAVAHHRDGRRRARRASSTCSARRT